MPVSQLVAHVDVSDSRSSNHHEAQWTTNHRSSPVRQVAPPKCIILTSRNQAYLATLKQEPEFADRSAGDIVSRLSVDTSILGDSVTSNLSDGLR